MDAVLRLNEVTGGYSQRRPYLQQITFEVAPGQMVGLLGLNGAGKSTTMKHILGLLRPVSGRIEVMGHPLNEAPELYRKSMAYIPESPLLYDELTVREHLEITAMAYGLTKSEFDKKAPELLDRFQMTDKANLLPAQLSKGMRQKVMLMSAFLLEPPLYLIDEPFLGLDPLGIRSLLELMMELKNRGSSLLVSSHILSTIEQYCDAFVVLHQGRVLADGSHADLAAKAGMGTGASLDDIFFALVSGEPR